MPYLAQANFSRWKVDVTPQQVQQFMKLALAIHEAAAKSPGFVWRYVDEYDNRGVVPGFGDERTIFNMSVWRSVDALKDFSFKNLHARAMERRANWFEPVPPNHLVMWWIAEDHIPTVQEAKVKFDLLKARGPTAAAFTFAKTFAPPVEAERTTLE